MLLLALSAAQFTEVSHDLEAGEWILWSKDNEDERGHWCDGTNSNGYLTELDWRTGLLAIFVLLKLMPKTDQLRNNSQKGSKLRTIDELIALRKQLERNTYNTYTHRYLQYWFRFIHYSFCVLFNRCRLVLFVVSALLVCWLCFVLFVWLAGWLVGCFDVVVIAGGVCCWWWWRRWPWVTAAMLRQAWLGSNDLDLSGRSLWRDAVEVASREPWLRSKPWMWQSAPGEICMKRTPCKGSFWLLSLTIYSTVITGQLVRLDLSYLEFRGLLLTDVPPWPL